MALLLPIFVWGMIVVGLLSFILFRRSRRRMYALAKDIPAKPALPIIGHALQFTGSSKDITNELQSLSNFTYKTNGICKVWLGPKLYIGMTNPKDIEIVLNTTYEKANAYNFMKVWVGNGLISGSVDIWKRHRKMLMPCFNQKVLDGFICTYNEQSKIMLDNMSVEIGKGEFDLFKYIGLTTLDIVCETAMGIKINAQSRQNIPYVESGIDLLELIYTRMFQIWIQPDFMYRLFGYKKIVDKKIDTVHSFSNEIIRKRKEEYRQKQEAIKQNVEYTEPVKYKAFLDTMLENTEINKNFSDVELREEVDTMIIAAHDTSAQAVGFAISILAYLPDIQQKVVEELRDVFGDSDRSIEKDDFNKLIYLERVIKEVLRIFPIVPIIVRKVTKDIELENYTLPAGCECVISILGVHKDKSVWGEDAEEFNPDRFLKENYGEKHPCSYMPFSTGARNCIGKQYAMMSVKALLSSILRRYKVHTTVDYRTLPTKAEVVLKSEIGYNISIERRKTLFE